MKLLSSIDNATYQDQAFAFYHLLNFFSIDLNNEQLTQLESLGITITNSAEGSECFVKTPG